MPTDPTSGSVNVTRDTACSSRRAAGDAEDVVDRHARLVHGHVGERALAGDVADRPQPLEPVHAHVVVDGERRA